MDSAVRAGVAVQVGNRAAPPVAKVPGRQSVVCLGAVSAVDQAQALRPVRVAGDQDPPAEPPNAGDENARCSSSCLATPGMNPGFRSTWAKRIRPRSVAVAYRFTITPDERLPAVVRHQPLAGRARAAVGLRPPRGASLHAG